MNSTNTEIRCGQSPHRRVTGGLLFLYLSDHLHLFNQITPKNWKKQLTQQGRWNVVRRSSYSLLPVIKACLCLLIQFQGLGKTLSERFQVTWNKTLLHISSHFLGETVTKPFSFQGVYFLLPTSSLWIDSSSQGLQLLDNQEAGSPLD